MAESKVALGSRPIQVACDRCTQGVMDSTNPHLLGTCGCSCHTRTALGPTWTFVCPDCDWRIVVNHERAREGADIVAHGLAGYRAMQRHSVLHHSAASERDSIAYADPPLLGAVTEQRKVALDRAREQFDAAVPPDAGLGRLPGEECPHLIERQGCIYCADEYQGKDVQDGFCPSCNDGKEPSTCSTWHVVHADGTSTCAACKHEHPYRPGLLAAHSRPTPEVRP